MTIRCRLCDYVSAKNVNTKVLTLEFSKHCLSVLNILKTKASLRRESGCEPSSKNQAGCDTIWHAVNAECRMMFT